MSIPNISILSPMTAVVPFIIVVCINLLREGLEDIRKHQYDREANNSLSITFKKDKFEEGKWADLQVGEIIKIKKNEIISVDILIIKSSLENGFCYLETTNLDGENTLKPREAIAIGQNEISNDNNIVNLFSNTFIEVDKPNNNIYNIEGTLFIDGKDKGNNNNKEKVYFNINNILLRGGRLKNVDYIYGIILYTGSDTKLMKNINHSSKKVSSVNKKINYIILILAIIVIILCITLTILGSIHRNLYLPDYNQGLILGDYLYYYRGNKPDNLLEVMRIFVGHFSIINTLIPFSITIVLICVNSYQAVMLEFFEPSLQQDEGDKVRCFSMSLLDEMGMVNYIFTDKTGTLTRNEMEFKACSIFNVLFDEEERDKVTIDNMTNHRTAFTLSTFTNTNTASMFSKSFNKHIIYENLFKEIPIRLTSQIECPFKSFKYVIREFLFNLSLNHNVLTEYDNEKKQMSFQGANPDEVTLVSAAVELGFRFEGRNNQIIKVAICNLEGGKDIKSFEVLQLFEFTSSRQRSSIIVKDLETNDIKLYLKGSDRKLFESIDIFSIENILPQTKEHADSFARRGLRTLCYSFKNINPVEYEEWKKEYDELKYKSINDKSLYPQLEESITSIENNTILLGVTALEDKLQESVKEDLQSFIDAGINVWMITGDKLDTAESIGNSCKLFSDDTEIFKIKDTSNINEVIGKLKEISKDMIAMDAELKKLSLAEDKKDKKDEVIQPLKDIRDRENNIIIFKSNHLESEQNFLHLKDDNDNDNDNDDIINSNNKLLKTKKRGSYFNNKMNHDSVHDGSILKYMMDIKLISESNNHIYDNLSFIQKENLKESKNNQHRRSSQKKYSNKRSSEDGILPCNQEKFLNYFNKCKSELIKYQHLKESKNLKHRLKFWESSAVKSNAFDFKMNFGIIIEGQAISLCIQTGETSDLFWELIKKSRSIICCRCSPIQKAEVVKFIKEKSKKITLAIGDGGNDVNMIKTANVGIGLFGKEGYQAAYNSDYAISQFKYLKRLLFYNGHFSIERNSYFLYFYFFKNIIFTIPQFLNAFYNGFSGANLYDEWFYMGYNSFVTVLPVASRAVCEEDFDPEFKNYLIIRELLKSIVPEIYKEYRDKIPFTYCKFFLILFVGSVISLPLYLFPSTDFQYGIRDRSGLTFSYWDISVSSYYSIVFVHFFIILNDTHFYNWVVAFFYGVQIATDLLFLIIYEVINYGTEVSGHLLYIMSNLDFWLNTINTSAIIIVSYYIYRRFEFFFGNNIIDKIKISKCEDYYVEKYYKQKISLMTKATRAVAKFKKIYNLNTDEEFDNLVDQQMKKIVDDFKEKKRLIKEKNR